MSAPLTEQQTEDLSARRQAAVNAKHVALARLSSAKAEYEIASRKLMQIQDEWIEMLRSENER